MLSLRLAIVLFVATQPVLAAEPAEEKPKETAAQQAVRHDVELKAVQATVEALVKEFPLLTGPGWEEKLGKFRAELAKPEVQPKATEPRPIGPAFAVNARRAPKTGAQMQTEIRERDLARMKSRSDMVVAASPELREYVEAQFQWHKRLSELRDKYTGNMKVGQFLRNRLEVPVPQGVIPRPQ